MKKNLTADVIAKAFKLIEEQEDNYQNVYENIPKITDMKIFEQMLTRNAKNEETNIELQNIDLDNVIRQILAGKQFKDKED